MSLIELRSCPVFTHGKLLLNTPYQVSRNVPTCVLVHYSMTFLNINSASSVCSHYV